MIAKITNSGENNSTIFREITKGEFKLLKSVFTALNNTDEACTPFVYIEEVGEYCVQLTQYDEFAHKNRDFLPEFFGTQEECHAELERLHEEDPYAYYNICKTKDVEIGLWK